MELTADDVAIIDLLELDLASQADEVPGCERDKCSAAGVNMILHVCCGYSYSLCAHHTAALRDFLSFAQELGTLRCLLCDINPAPTPSILPR